MNRDRNFHEFWQVVLDGPLLSTPPISFTLGTYIGCSEFVTIPATISDKTRHDSWQNPPAGRHARSSAGENLLLPGEFNFSFSAAPF